MSFNGDKIKNDIIKYCMLMNFYVYDNLFGDVNT